MLPAWVYLGDSPEERFDLGNTDSKRSLAETKNR